VQHNTSQLQVRIFSYCWTANTLLFSDNSLKQELLPVMEGVGNQCTSLLVEKMDNKKKVSPSASFHHTITN
jgi:hypothetical protein